MPLLGIFYSVYLCFATIFKECIYTQSYLQHLGCWNHLEKSLQLSSQAHFAKIITINFKLSSKTNCEKHEEANLGKATITGHTKRKRFKNRASLIHHTHRKV